MQELSPFEAGSRYHRKLLQVQPVLDSQTVGDKIKKLGYASRLQLEVFVQFTLAASATYTGDAIYQLGRAFAKKINFGTSQSAQLVSCSAFGLYLLSFADTGVNWNTAMTGTERMANNGGGQQAYTFPAGQNTLRFRIDVPIAYNQDLNYDLGLVNVQNDDVTWEWSLDFGQLGALFDDPSKVTAVDGFVQPILHHFDAPPREQFDQPALDHVVKISEEIQNIVVGSGNHIISLPRGNAYAQMIHHVTNGGVPASTHQPYLNANGNLRTYELRMQDSTTDERLPVWFIEQEMRRRYGQAVPAGTIILDNTFDTGFPGRFQTGMNILDTSDFTELDVILEVQNMNAVNSKIRTVRRELVTLP